MQTKQNEIPANEQGFFNLMSLAITALVALPVGIACLVLGFGLGDNPCVMCWAERITMIPNSAFYHQIRTKAWLSSSTFTNGLLGHI